MVNGWINNYKLKHIKNKTMAQQTNLTAVEWLIEQLQAPCRGIPSHIVEQAKQMEKEQLVKAWDDGDYAYFYSKETGRDFDNGEQYYNETYKK
jgi:hypothetical protein